MSTALLEVRGLAVGWGDRPLLEDLDFSVEAGEIVAILGASGAGKSTLLRHLIGLEMPLAGEVRLLGDDDRSGPPPFGVLFQSGALFGSLTLLQNVALPLQEWTDLPPDAVDAIARARLALVGLTGAEPRLPAELSGGMRKRAGIARALALEPPLLFLDEPSAGLDPVTAAGLDALLLSLNASLGLTIVVVTHELDSIFRIAGRCLMLDGTARGIIAEGDPRRLREQCDDPRVHAFFNRQAGTEPRP